MSRASMVRFGLPLLYSMMSVVWSSSVALAQDLPPELTGDYSDLPPPTPAPRPKPRDREPVPDDPPIDPELGDVGPVAPVAPELSDEPGPADTEPAEETTEPVEDAEVSEPEVEPAPVGRPRFYLGLGLGAGTLSFSRPASGGIQVLPTTPYAAADLDLRVHMGHANAWSWEALLSYQTSLGLVIENAPLFALPEDIAVRVQRFELSLGLRLRLSDAVALVLPVGFGMQLFTPETHQYEVEAYALGGLLVQPQLLVTLSERVSVRVGPDAQWLFKFNPSLQREGACCSGGALGAQATLQASLGRVFSLALTYRELRTLIPAAARFSAIDRVVTARLVGEL